MVEQLTLNQLVLGSSPSRGTSLPKKTEAFSVSDAVSAQNPAESESKAVRFPKVVRHRRAEVKIYGESRHYPFYRLAYCFAGKRQQRTFATYSEAKAEADKLLRELADGSQASALSATQARDALAALERLEVFRQSTGQRVSLLAAVECGKGKSACKVSSVRASERGESRSLVQSQWPGAVAFGSPKGRLLTWRRANSCSSAISASNHDHCSSSCC